MQKHNPNRVNVYLDGEFAFGLARILAAWLGVGQTISDEKIAQLQADDAMETAYQRAINLLDSRQRSAAEIQQNLRRHNINEEIIQAVLVRLQRSGLIDDARFARSWVENRNDFRPRSRRALSYELRSRGIETNVIDSALAELDEDELAYRAALTKSRKFAQLDRQEYQLKLLQFLARRGFSYETSRQAVERVWSESHNDQNNLTYGIEEE